MSVETIIGFAALTALRVSSPWMAATGFPNVNSSGEDIDSCEAPRDDSREPRFPVIGRCRRSES